jgi:hypothetical protein
MTSTIGNKYGQKKRFHFHILKEAENRIIRKYRSRLIEAIKYGFLTKE